ncbi:hypothetical protein FPOAC1_007553 [Fusarium poae]|uniref:hypothetical protein n=1 Tax=Fusarium poae TaxID=36050 RepID=UPI001CEBEB71|nr:hypothetical protein FPOAC1_007553 [Fusarium poae]KAG8668176.1 hypothetical protein FPOAC1_007553 [Fusarium poae]
MTTRPHRLQKRPLLCRRDVELVAAYTTNFSIFKLLPCDSQFFLVVVPVAVSVGQGPGAIVRRVEARPVGHVYADY